MTRYPFPARPAWLYARPGHRGVPVVAADGDAERDQRHRRRHGDVIEDPDVVFNADGQSELACPTWTGARLGVRRQMTTNSNGFRNRWRTGDPNGPEMAGNRLAESETAGSPAGRGRPPAPHQRRQLPACSPALSGGVRPPRCAAARTRHTGTAWATALRLPCCRTRLHGLTLGPPCGRGA